MLVYRREGIKLISQAAREEENRCWMKQGSLGPFSGTGLKKSNGSESLKTVNIRLTVDLKQYN